ncbi:hypothetical protein COCNU_scaffold001459G000090 [Cocos nucifera]|nr:hypothetical protein [Cocos nucifera]
MINRLMEEKAAKVGSLQEVLKEEEKTSMGLKVALASEEEKRKKIEGKVSELERQVSRHILEAKAQAIEEFKIFSEIRDLNIQFSKEAFQKGFELYED